MDTVQEATDFKSVRHNLLSCCGILVTGLVKNTITFTMVVILREALKPGPSEQEKSWCTGSLQVSSWLPLSLSWVQKPACGTTICCSLLLGVANGWESLSVYFWHCAPGRDTRDLLRATVFPVTCSNSSTSVRNSEKLRLWKNVFIVLFFLRWGKQLILLMAIRAGVDSGSIFNP